MKDESNESIWERVFDLELTPKSQNTTFNCFEYSSSCPDCGGKDRLSVFAEDNPILACCWGEKEGRNGCGKRFYRKDYLNNIGGSKRQPPKIKQQIISPKETQDRKDFIETAHAKIFGKGYEPAYLFAKSRGFSSDLMEKLKLGAVFEKGKGVGLVLPVFKPSIYYQIRWVQWDETKSYPKYQNPKGKKVSPAVFSSGSQVALVFESLIDAMLAHEVTGYTTLSAMGARLRDQDLAIYDNVFLVPDQDVAGDRNFGLMGSYGRIPLPDGYKDMGEMIQGEDGLDITKYYIEQVVRSQLESNNAQQEPQAIPVKESKIVPIPLPPALKEIKPDPVKETLEYQYIRTRKEAEKAVERLVRSQGKVALDTETTGLDFQSDKIRLVQLYEPSVGCFLFDLFEIGDTSFLKPLERRDFIIHYAPFDIKFLRKSGISLKNYSDTKMMGAFVCPIPNPKEGKRDNLEIVPKGFIQRNLSLKGLLYAYLDVDIPKEKHIRKGWEGEISEEKLEYAARDVLYLHTLHDSLEEEIKSLGMQDIYTHYSKALKAHIEMEWIGAPIRQTDLLEAIIMLEPLENCIEIIERYGIDNPNSTKQLSEYVMGTFPDVDIPKTTSGKQLKLDIDALETLKDKDPFFKDIYEYKKLTTAHKEHLKLQDAISPITKRVHASFTILGASSGRTLSSNPNFQGQSVKVKPFVGYSNIGVMRITTADYSQQELRIFSLITDNKDFIELLERGEDGYKAIASTITGKDPKEISDKERKPFKTATLALLYGQGAKSLSEKLDLPLKETKDLYQEIKDLLNVVDLQKGLRERQLDKKHIPTFFGEKGRPIQDKWKTLREYQLINYCIQGTASNIGILALNKISDELPEGVNIIGYIHDEFLLEHDKTLTDKVQEIVSKAMEEAFLECFPKAKKQRKYLVDIKTGKNWIK
jgi:DNA polymerase I-like protein with 3'-5' exonuclease and polymerase domains